MVACALVAGHSEELMAVAVNISGAVRVAGLCVGVLAGATAAAQQSDVRSPEATALRPNQAMILLDYQVLRVKGDEPIDLMGFHVHNKVADWLYVGAGMSAPLFKGKYGGFATFDIGAHAQQRLTAQLFATAGLAAGGGAGGRSVENAKALAGTGGFVKGYVGLGYDFGAFSVGANATRMKFRRSAIDGTQANVFVQIPYTYFTGPFASHGERLLPADARQANEASSERMLTVVFDNYRQRKPEGTFKGPFYIVDLQYSQYFATDIYWFAALGSSYKGLPLSNQILGGVGQRVQISPHITVYGQLGIGSGIYAPEVINTDSGLLVYPKVSAEVALSKNLGLSLSAGYLVAPKGSSKNPSFGIALTRHLRVSDGPSTGSDSGSLPTYRAFRVSLFQETNLGVRYRDLDRGQVRMIGIQADAIINDHWYIPLQGAAAYSTYLGYPGYGELLGGIGLQSRADRDDRWQAFGQLMAGTNVHGVAVKGSGGLRYGLSDRVALSMSAGRIVAKSSAGNRFVANSVAVGLDYRFSIPSW
jgi:predicted secreted protein